jgi:hypothetical protein
VHYALHTARSAVRRATDAIPGSLSFTFVEPILSGFTTVESSYDAATLVLDGLEAQGATLMREPVRF